MRSIVDGGGVGSRYWSSGTLVVRIVKDGQTSLTRRQAFVALAPPAEKKEGAWMLWAGRIVRSATPLWLIVTVSVVSEADFVLKLLGLRYSCHIVHLIEERL